METQTCLIFKKFSANIETISRALPEGCKEQISMFSMSSCFCSRTATPYSTIVFMVVEVSPCDLRKTQGYEVVISENKKPIHCLSLSYQ